MRTHCKMIPEITKIQLQFLLSIIAKEIVLHRRLQGTYRSTRHGLLSRNKIAAWVLDNISARDGGAQVVH